MSRKGHLGFVTLLGLLLTQNPTSANDRVLMHTGPTLDAVRVLAMADAATAVGLRPSKLVLSGGSAIAGYLLNFVADPNERLSMLFDPEAAKFLCKESRVASSQKKRWFETVRDAASTYRSQSALSPRVPLFYDLNYFSEDQHPIQLVQQWMKTRRSRIANAPDLVLHGFEWKHLPQNQGALRDGTKIFLREVWTIDPSDHDSFQALRGSESPIARENLHGALARSILLENHRPLSERLEIAMAVPMHYPPFKDAQSKVGYLAGTWNQFPFEISQRLGSSILTANDGTPNALWEDRLARAWFGISLIDRHKKARNQLALQWVDFSKQSEFFGLIWDNPLADAWSKERCTFPANAPTNPKDHSSWIRALYLYAYEQTLRALRSP